MSAAAFGGTALFLWSRNRVNLVFCALGYGILLSGSEMAGVAHSPLFQSIALGYLLFTPVVFPLLMFISSGMNANADLTDPAGLFPRHFFVLPAATHRIVLPFMLYATLFTAVQWSAAELIDAGRSLAFLGGRLWVPFLAMSFIAWMQALLWTPVRGRFVRTMQLLALIFPYLFVCVESLRAAFSAELTVAVSVAQFPIAYAVAVRGVAKCRRGEPSPFVANERPRTSTSAARGRRGAPHLAGPLDAQVWMERQIHRWTGKSFLVALIPVVLLILLFVAVLSGAHGDAKALQTLGTGTIYVLLGSLVIAGIATGLNFGSFQANIPWNQPPAAYLMPAYFSALPLSSGDFAWAKMRAATARMLWVSAGVVLICAVVAKISGYTGQWLTQHAGWRVEYGVAATLALAALPAVAAVMLTLCATAGVMWIILIGRFRQLMPWTFCLVTSICIFVPAALKDERTIALLSVFIPIAAVVKVCGLVALVFYVGSRRVLSWSRLAAITAFWAATAGTLVAWLSWYAPRAPISPIHALCSAIVIAPVLGAVAAPLALGWNRAR